MNEVCELCKKHNKLCQSHIIPEWGYEGSYDNKHRLKPYDMLNHRKGLMKQKGIREKILCEKCETIFSVWEAYAKRVWESRTGNWTELPGGAFSVSGLDYEKLKLFLMSLLWRFDVAKSDIGESVSLESYSEPLRVMLLNEDPSEPMNYPCMMVRIMNEDEWMATGLRLPISGRWHGRRAYSVAFKGFGLLYIVSSQNLKDHEQRGCINRDGCIVIGTSQAECWMGNMGKLKIVWPPRIKF